MKKKAIHFRQIINYRLSDEGTYEYEVKKTVNCLALPIGKIIDNKQLDQFIFDNPDVEFVIS
jgi:hypothetical protein